MENHQPLQVLSGISFSDKAAINLKLKSKAKATWSFHGDAGADTPAARRCNMGTASYSQWPSCRNFRTSPPLRPTTSAKTYQHASPTSASRRGTDLNPYVSVALPEVTRTQQQTHPIRTVRRSRIHQCSLKARTWRVQDSARLFLQSHHCRRHQHNHILPPNDGDRVITENRSGVDPLQTP